MRILGIAGLVLALAIVGYLVVTYLEGTRDSQKALRALPGLIEAEQKLPPVHPPAAHRDAIRAARERH